MSVSVQHCHLNGYHPSLLLLLLPHPVPSTHTHIFHTPKFPPHLALTVKKLEDYIHVLKINLHTQKLQAWPHTWCAAAACIAASVSSAWAARWWTLACIACSNRGSLEAQTKRVLFPTQPSEE